MTKRPSRFDRKYHFKLPSGLERLAYCHYWREKFASSSPDNADDDGAAVELTEEICEIIAQWTEGYSFAYLKELFVSALLLHTRGDGADGEEDEEEGGREAEIRNRLSNASKTPAETTGGDLSVDGEKAEKQDSKVDATDGATTEPKRLPSVPIPSHLESSALLRVFRTQAQSLLEEMGHATDEKAAPVGGAAGEPPVRFRLQSLVDEGEGD